jgi:superfamily II DNA or RNA helicase
VSGEPAVGLVTNNGRPPDEFETVLRSKGAVIAVVSNESIDLRKAQWLKPLPTINTQTSVAEFERYVGEIIASWHNAFTYKEEQPDLNIQGLRPPQLAAIHAIRSHCLIEDEPATIVMPTGTGKTETMLSVLITQQCARVLVVVPTDALRSQIADKFLTLGILKDPAFAIVSPQAAYPIVGVMYHRPQSANEVDAFFRKCNVIVTTMPLAAQCSVKIHERMAKHCSHLFIDEAHHVSAPTWSTFKAAFSGSQILQFTATPYRSDDKPVEGKPIFNFSLRRAQAMGYFQPIAFKRIAEFDPRKKDEAIAEAAVEQLRLDYDRGHILMARVSTIPRAEQVFRIYEKYADFKPVQMHTGIKSKAERDRIRRQILQGESRIVVCVDMLGEGFDLPELKIAAFHDVRKSLPVTLQLAGRFTRARSDLGNATFIANVADVEVTEELHKLYQQDTDWNQLLPQFSDEAIEEETENWRFFKEFKAFPDAIALQNVRPAMSTVVYKTQCTEWTPDSFEKGLQKARSLDRIYHDLNAKDRTLVIVTAKREPVDWAQANEVHTWNWQLYVLYWWKEKALLFIHNSSNSGFFKDLAKAVAGEVQLVSGPKVFRCLGNISRLKLQNVGLIEQLGRLIRFTMRAGSDVEPAMSEAQKQKAIKSNVFGAGYEHGHKTSVGCSYKGRIWSRRVTNLRALTRWCQDVGLKILDDSIDPEAVLKGTLVPVQVRVIPSAVPIAIEWPEVLYQDSETAVQFNIDGEVIHFHEADIQLGDPIDGSLTFTISGVEKQASYRLALFPSGDASDFRFDAIDKVESSIQRGDATKPLSEFFTDHAPTIWFADGSSLTGNSHVEPKAEPEPFVRANIQTWDWTGINLKKEAQGIAKSSDTIQYRVIERLKSRPFSLVFDDDGAGETADVVAIEEERDSLVVELYHCKYIGGEGVGKRVKDLYEVCGQAQKCVRWIEKPSKLFTRLLAREPKKRKGKTATRYEVGTPGDLMRIREKSRRQHVRFRMFIVQPGLSKAGSTREQLELLGVTDNYLKETLIVPLGVICSD